MMWGLLLIGYFAAAVIAHAALVRSPFPGGIVLKFLLAGGFLGTALVVHALLVLGLCTPAAASILGYALLCEFYIFLFTMVSSSVSASLLMLLRSRAAAVGELDALYSGAGMVLRRLEKMHRAGLLEVRDGNYSLTPKAYRLLSIFGLLRGFFRHDDQTPRHS